MITETNIIVPPSKRKQIAALAFKDVDTYVVDVSGKLAVIHPDGTAVDENELLQAVIDFVPNPELEFDTAELVRDLNDAFQGLKAVTLAPWLRAFEDYADARNFAGIKALIDGLVAAGHADANDKTTFYAVIATQGIDLNKY